MLSYYTLCLDKVVLHILEMLIFPRCYFWSYTVHIDILPIWDIVKICAFTLVYLRVLLFLPLF